MRLFLLFLCSVALVFGQSQPPAPSGGKITQPKQAQPARDNSQTTTDKDLSIQFPPSINVHIPDPIHIVREDHSEDSDHKSSSDRWIVFFTGCLVILAAMQFWAMRRQAEYMRKGLDETKKAADAATKSANTAEQALRLTERAEVFIDSAALSTAPNFFPETIVSITLRNFGRTRADEFRPHLWLGNPNRTNELEPSVTVPTVIPPLDTATCEYPKASDCFPPGVVQAVNEGKMVLMFEGHFVYRDIFGTEHSVWCNGTLDRSKGTFSLTQKAGRKTRNP